MRAVHVAVESLSVTFASPDQESILALDDLSLEVMVNEFVCIVGPSGCGKSTLLKVVAGMVPATEGAARVIRTGSGELPTAMVWQESALIPWRTIRENVALPLELRGVGKKERRQLAEQALERMGLAQFANVYPHQVSGGMRQRAGIARALVANAEVLLMDEPFGAVDAQTRVILQEEILDLWQQSRMTVLFVTHSIEEALLLGDRVVVMSARPGRIIETIAVPFSRPRSLEIKLEGEFQDLEARIWELLRHDVVRAEQLA